MLRPKNPYRISAVGQNTGVTAIVSAMSDDYHSTFFSGYGVRVNNQTFKFSLNNEHRLKTHT